ncbi:nitrilase-related carbon-nitrogen hydrolase [Agrococcus sp. SGAir0287]|uniref:nitrilase-related carbon-nitrogen hydrolase n=1 Tax=Agrococcus sp. SGAir0287 TaxID=2070347 RepID=UPI0010CD51DD|nr:nitrilase-related carbon-nitrogen hydrolase [Agrococcus sp. SGAir0287]QCR20263.1 carbon-nitrogen hydrolase [Agrococcus sp. SGAir0287]
MALDGEQQARSIAIAARSPRIRAGEPEANLDAARAAIADAVAAGARLIVLPELLTSGYALTSQDEARALAIDAGDAALASLAADLPADAVLVVGFAERAGASIANSVGAITRDGVLAVYRKTHLWDLEQTLFEPGDAEPPVVETPIGRLGLAICYDLEFPEVPRALALAGAEVIAAPVAWPLVDRPAGERPPELIQAMGSARTSRIPIVIADHHGDDRGIDWTGGTAIVDAYGWVADAGETAATATVEIPADTRAGDRNDLLGDRRPELYRGLLDEQPSAPRRHR